ncbi:MAG: zinc-binding dehydrogenase [bacterium]
MSGPPGRRGRCAAPRAGLTASRALVTRAALRPGERVLDHGHRGHALAALQIAVAMGAAVAVTSSDPAKIERALELGAAGGELYTQGGWAGRVRSRFAPRGFDVIVDSAGGEGFGELPARWPWAAGWRSFGVRAASGRPSCPVFLFYKQVSLLATTMGSPPSSRTGWRSVAEHGAASWWTPPSRWLRALGRSRPAAGSQFGKVVLKIQPAG